MPENEEAERRHWRAFWDEVPGWAKTAIIALGAWAASAQIAGSSSPSKDLEPRIRELELGKVKLETSLDAMRTQLDRIERKLDSRRASIRPRADLEG